MADAGQDAFYLVAEYAVALGAKFIGDLPGCWEKGIDEHWWVAVNGHDDDVVCSRGTPVPPGTCYVEHKKWPAGMVTEDGGVIEAGNGADVVNFMAAVRRAMGSL